MLYNLECQEVLRGTKLNARLFPQLFLRLIQYSTIIMFIIFYLCRYVRSVHSLLNILSNKYWIIKYLRVYLNFLGQLNVQ